MALGDELIERCVAESGLLRGRVEGERGRTVGQLRFFADIVRKGDFLRTVKDAALSALARKSGRPGVQRDWQLEAARAEIAQLTEAVKAQAIELAVVRGKSGWG